MAKYKVTMKLTYTIEADTASDAKWVVESGRDGGFLPLYYWCEQEDYDKFNEEYRRYLGEEAGSKIMLSKDSGAEYEVEEV